MPSPNPDPEGLLRALHASTDELRRAVDAADLAGAAVAAARRGQYAAALTRCRQTWSPDLLARLEKVLSHGEAAVRTLASRRETARALLSEIEPVRLRLANATPVSNPRSPRKLDLEA